MGFPMSDESKNTLSDTTANVVENLACRIAERHRGRITAHHLIPYLPMSLGLIDECLTGMVDEASVTVEISGGVTEYLFAAYLENPLVPGILNVDGCLACDADISNRPASVLCGHCSKTIQKELNALAEQTGWPAQAVYEHEILYLAARTKGPAYAAELAGHSRLTLRNLRKKLERLCLDGYVRQELDAHKGVPAYHFPEMEYPRELYRANMQLIRSYPASVMEDVELKVTRIFFALGLLILVLFLAAFLLHLPFPLVVLLFLISAPITALCIWRRKTLPADM
jgi:hypothetical protein